MAKNVYIISPNGSIIKFTEDEYNEMLPEDMKKLYEEIGNKFGKKSDAKLVVEKLKALKRLKDKGFTFKTYQRSPQGTYDIYANWDGYMPPLSWMIDKDLNLLFGGEDER